MVEVLLVGRVLLAVAIVCYSDRRLYLIRLTLPQRNDGSSEIIRNDEASSCFDSPQS